MRTHTDKLVIGPEPEYFDLAADPGELENRHARAGERVAALRARLEERLAGWAGTGADGARTLSREEIARLAALGYVHQPEADGAVPALDELANDLPDPKSMIRSKQKIKQAFAEIRANRWNEALRISREAVNECPAYADASTQLAMILDRMGRPDEAARVLQSLLDRRPDTQAAIELARMHVVAGRYDAMEAALAVAAELEPDNGLIHIIRGDRFGRENRWDEAIAEYEAALRVDEQRTGDIARQLLQRARQQAGVK
jgi:tetratricopeptide (TPR) repeat protein